MTIHIEIAKGYREGTWQVRIGDIEGCTELCNVSEEELIDEIKDKLLETEVLSKQVKGGEE